VDKRGRGGGGEEGQLRPGKGRKWKKSEKGTEIFIYICICACVVVVCACVYRNMFTYVLCVCIIKFVLKARFVLSVKSLSLINTTVL
jgi:hypothetical protein